MITRDEFLAQCAAAETNDDIAGILHQLVPDPPWFRKEDAEVAVQLWRIIWIHLLEAQRLLVEARQREADVQAMRAAAQAATDDLDLFQAGYERGYAQGWQHRGAQPKEDV